MMSEMAAGGSSEFGSGVAPGSAISGSGTEASGSRGPGGTLRSRPRPLRWIWRPPHLRCRLPPGLVRRHQEDQSLAPRPSRKEEDAEEHASIPSVSWAPSGIPSLQGR